MNFLDRNESQGGEYCIEWIVPFTLGGFTMWRQNRLVVAGVLISLLVSACAALENSPPRLLSYLAADSSEKISVEKSITIPSERITGTLVVINDAEFPKAAPHLKKETLQSLGGYLQAEIQKQVPVTLDTLVFPEDIIPSGSPDRLKQLGEEQGVPYVILAVLSGAEWEVPERLPLDGFSQGTGLRSPGLVGYRAENYSRLEIAVLDVKTGKVLVMSDGKDWATLERLATPMESNVYPVVRRALTQPPIYPNSDRDAFETLRWASGQGAIDQAVMHLKEAWKTEAAS